MKFVHNGEEKDEKVQQISWFLIDFYRSKINPHDADFILKTLKILWSSGIFWWWEKWKQINFHKDRQIWRNSTEFIDESLAEFKPLSFQDSDVHLVFLIWLLFLILPATAFFLESSVKFLDNIFDKFWNLYQEKWQKSEKPNTKSQKSQSPPITITKPITIFVKPITDQSQTNHGSLTMWMLFPLSSTLWPNL